MHFLVRLFLLKSLGHLFLADVISVHFEVLLLDSHTQCSSKNRLVTLVASVADCDRLTLLVESVGVEVCDTLEHVVCVGIHDHILLILLCHFKTLRRHSLQVRDLIDAGLLVNVF